MDILDAVSAVYGPATLTAAASKGPAVLQREAERAAADAERRRAARTRRARPTRTNSAREN
jgi:hypothetical protein